MNEFKGDTDISFGTVGYLAHLFLALSSLLVCFALLAWKITGNTEPYSYMLGYGGIGIVIGVILGFSKIFTSK